MINFLKKYFNIFNETKDLEKSIENILTKYSNKVNDLKIDIEKLYEMTDELNSCNFNADYLEGSSNDAILLFDKDGKLESFNENCLDFFKKIDVNDFSNKYNIFSILKLLKLNIDDSTVLESIKMRKKVYKTFLNENNSLFKNENYIFISTPLFSDINEISKVALRIKQLNIDNFKKTHFKFYFDFLNLIYFNKNNLNYSQFIENKFKNVFKDDNLNNLFKKLEVIIHPEDYNNVKSIISKKILSNSSFDMHIKCRIKIKQNKYVWFLGNAILINLDNSSIKDNIFKFSIKFAGFLFDTCDYNKIKNTDIFDKYVMSLNDLQFLFRNDIIYNIEKLTDLIKDTFNINYIAYFKNDHHSNKNILFLNDLILKNRKIENIAKQFILDYSNNTIKIPKSGTIKLQTNLYVFVKKLYFNNQSSHFFYFLTKDEFDLKDSKEILLNLICAVLKKEEYRVLNKIISNISLDIINNINNWVWIKDDNDTLLFLNKTFISEVLDGNINNIYIRSDDLNISDNFSDDIKEMLLYKDKEKVFQINKNNKKINIKVKVKLSLDSEDNKIWYSTTEIVKNKKNKKICEEIKND